MLRLHLLVLLVALAWPSALATENPAPGSIPVILCPGATAEQHNPGWIACDRPTCTTEDWMSGRLFPTEDPTLYFKCGPGTGNVFTMQCAPETCFSVQDQACVHFRKWTNDCALIAINPWD